MKTVKIKVKHLIIFIVVFITVIYIFIPSAVFIYANRVEKKSQDRAAVIYKSYVDYFPLGIKRDEALYKVAYNLFSAGNARIKIFPTAMQSGRYVDLKMVEEAEKFYEEIITKYKRGKYYNKAYASLCYLYTVTGRAADAEKLIDNGLTSSNNAIKLTASKYKMFYLRQNGQNNDAITLANNLVNNKKADKDIYTLLGETYLSLKDYDKALDNYKKSIKAPFLPDSHEEGIGDLCMAGNNYPDFRMGLVNKIKNGYTGNSVIHGQVLADGKPVPLTYVYLKDQKDGIVASIGNESSSIYVITDFNGNYSISGIPEGNYVVGVGISNLAINDLVFEEPSYGYFHLKSGESKEYNFNFVPPLKITRGNGIITPQNGKVQLEWERVNGAAYYIVRCIEFEIPGKHEGSAAYFPISDKITDNKYAIDTENANNWGGGFMSNDNGIVNPQAYLGIFYPGCNVPVFIDAYDHKGRKLTSSATIRTRYDKTSIISMNDENITEGDKLVLDLKPDKAAQSYEKELIQRPNDIRILNVLSRIYKTGTYVKFGEKEEIKGRNFDRAIELLERLYELTGDYAYIKRIGQIYMDNNDFTKCIKEYTKIPQDKLNYDDYSALAKAELQLGNFSAADKYYERIYLMCKDLGYYDLMPVILDIYNGDFDNAIKFLDIIELANRNVDRDKFKSNIELIKALNNKSSDYVKFKQGLRLELALRQGNDFKNNFINIYESIDEPVLSEFLKQIAYYEYILY